MELVAILNRLWRLRLFVVVAAVLAVVLGLSTVYKLPSMQPRSYEFAAASTQILIDSPKSTLGDLSQDLTPLTTRASVYARFMASEPVRAEIARLAGVPAAKITASSPVDGNGQPGAIEPGAERRASQLASEGDHYRLFFQAEASLPVVAVYAQAPTVEGAERIADSATEALKNFLSREAQDRVPAASRIQVEQLGKAQGELVNDGASKIVAVLASGAAFVALCMFIIFASWFRHAWKVAREGERAEQVEEGWDDWAVDESGEPQPEAYDDPAAAPDPALGDVPDFRFDDAGELRAVGSRRD